VKAGRRLRQSRTVSNEPTRYWPYWFRTDLTTRTTMNAARFSRKATQFGPIGIGNSASPEREPQCLLIPPFRPPSPHLFPSHQPPPSPPPPAVPGFLAPPDRRQFRSGRCHRAGGVYLGAAPHRAVEGCHGHIATASWERGVVIVVIDPARVGGREENRRQRPTCARFSLGSEEPRRPFCQLREIMTTSNVVA